MIQKIVPCLWFDNQAEDAARFYVSIFKDSKIGALTRYSDQGPGPQGQVLTVDFTLDGQEFTGLNGGPMFHFSEAISFVVNCDSQAEVDYFWDKLTAGGEEQPCGWLKDKFGVSWQIVPEALMKMLHDPDAARVSRVTAALYQMRKIELAPLEAAYRGAL